MKELAAARDTHMLSAKIQRSFEAVGLTVARKPRGAPVVQQKKFAPDPCDEWGWLRSAGIRTVLDIGAHAGETSCKMRSILPNAAIYAFEPLPGPFARLMEQMGGDDNFSAFQFCLGAIFGRVEMQENEFSQSSSLLPMADRLRREFPFAAKTDQRFIEVRRLDDVVAGLTLNEPMLVKIDVQGFEDRVIAGGEHTIKNASVVIVEVSFVELYEGQPLFADIYDQLRGLGFVYGGAVSQLNSPVNGQPLQADAVFLRNPSQTV